VADYLS